MTAIVPTHTARFMLLHKGDYDPYAFYLAVFDAWCGFTKNNSITLGMDGRNNIRNVSLRRLSRKQFVIDAILSHGLKFNDFIRLEQFVKNKTITKAVYNTFQNRFCFDDKYVWVMKRLEIFTRWTN